jgi:hypothetical protein
MSVQGEARRCGRNVLLLKAKLAAAGETCRCGRNVPPKAKGGWPKA